MKEWIVGKQPNTLRAGGDGYGEGGGGSTNHRAGNTG